jgi:DNA-binding PadR family transcriptional regulator
MAIRRKCACEGHTLDRLLQPTVMAILAKSPMHGYVILEELKQSPLMQGSKPDPSGVYRLLDTMEDQGMVRHELNASDKGPSKRVYELTSLGRKCLGKWAATLDEYEKSIAALVKQLQMALADTVD